MNEAREQLLNLFNEYNMILIEAPTGTGKTNFMTTVPGELISPLRIIQEQMNAKVGTEDVITVKGTRDTEEQVYFSKFTSRTFASASERPSLNHDIVHVDEFHYTLDYALIDHDSYMAVENKIYNSLAQGKTVVLYSATPEIAILLVELLGMPIELHVKLIALENSCFPKSIEYWENKHPKHNSYSPDSYFISKVSEEIKHFIHKGKFIVLCRTIKTAETLYQNLNKVFPNLNVQIYTSSHPNLYISQNLIKEESIPQNVNVLITTTILSTGTNILNEDIHCAICEWPISTTIIQFSARFRSNNHHLIIYGSPKDLYEGVQSYDFQNRLGENFLNYVWIRYKMYSNHLADYYILGEHQNIVLQLEDSNSKYSSPFAIIKLNLEKNSPLTARKQDSNIIKLNQNWKQQLTKQIQTIEQYHKSTAKILVSIPKLINLNFKKQDYKWFSNEETAINYILNLFKQQTNQTIPIRTTIEKIEKRETEQKNNLKWKIANELVNYFDIIITNKERIEIIEILKQFGIKAKPNTLKREIQNIGFEIEELRKNNKNVFKIFRNKV